VDVGNVVEANKGPLLVIQRLDPIYADFTITENDLTSVQRNMEQGTLKVEVRLPDEAGDPRPGELTFLDNAVQDGTGTVKLRATVPNGDQRFWPGRFVKVRLVLSTIKDAVLVPASAPQTSAKGQFVYVVKDDSTAEMRPVTLGQRHEDRVVVAQGLAAGERVVIEGQMAVMPGGKVRVAEPAAPAAERAAGASSTVGATPVAGASAAAGARGRS
jgi:multidrug efflux system membrane fusion protein